MNLPEEKGENRMFLTLGAIVGRLLHLKRTCPKCRRDQIVPAAKKKETVHCKFCGIDIPPPSKNYNYAHRKKSL